MLEANLLLYLSFLCKLPACQKVEHAWMRNDNRIWFLNCTGNVFFEDTPNTCLKIPHSLTKLMIVFSLSAGECFQHKILNSMCILFSLFTINLSRFFQHFQHPCFLNASKSRKIEKRVLLLQYLDARTNRPSRIKATDKERLHNDLYHFTMTVEKMKTSLEAASKRGANDNHCTSEIHSFMSIFYARVGYNSWVNELLAEFETSIFGRIFETGVVEVGFFPVLLSKVMWTRCMTH